MRVAGGPHTARPALSLVLGFVSLALVVTGSLSVTGSDMRCTYGDTHTFANCSNLMLEHVPWSLHKSIQSLDLSGNHFPTLKNISFISYGYISYLCLRNNSIKTVQANAFDSLDYLNNLDLSNNLLQHIPSSALNVVAKSLLQLILSGNRIQVLTKDVFAKLSKLQLLDLNGNSISRIDYGAMAGLGSLQMFKLRYNQLSSLPSDAFNASKQSLKQVHLYDNRWTCDCNMRWLRQWMNETSEEVWMAPGYYIRCDSPSIVKDKDLASLPMDELACEVMMKSSSATQDWAKGDNATLMCKYTSVPDVEAKWLRNNDLIDVSKDVHKYTVASSNTSSRGEKIQVSELKIFNFQYADIARYECFVQNILGAKKTEYKLTLQGIAFDSVSLVPPSATTGNAGVDTRSIVIAVAVVCGIILFIVIGILIFCTVNRVQRRKQEKQEIIRANIKQHFINSEVMSNGDISGLNDTKQSSKSMEDKLDGNIDDDRSTSNNTNDSNTTAVKRPLDLDDTTEPMFIFQQPGSPFNNGNTYVSFGSELTDPGDFPSQPPQYPQGPDPRYESSHTGSATPLLERYTPSVFDSDEPVEDYAQYPVYDSLTNSLQHPHSQGDGIYGGSARIGSASSYASTPNRHGDNSKRLSSFHYPPSVNGSMPRAIGSTRSVMALAPRYSDFSSDSSPRPDLHRQTPNPLDYREYRDYRDMRYPMTTPPPHRMTQATPKSMSVGNLGYTPVAAGPRKPPRLFQSREYMELTPHESNVEYITSPEAQQYSQSYGITPGTPV
ncbi:unnamed protein product [Lymnaea stagnalis]|uniref:Ig-like domain-containing protein n=1 Tax=Lymnaea stagnalis TaxID=6523 RepID=A0AAV2H4C2_LYMST